LYAKIPDYLGLQQIKLLKASGSSTIAVCLLLVVQEGFLRRTHRAFWTYTKLNTR